MSKPSLERKLKEGRGTGEKENYKPWIYARETASLGTTSTPYSYKEGRKIQCLSQAEAKVFYLLEFDPDITDIREQYPLLPVEEGIAIAKALNAPTRHPKTKAAKMKRKLTADDLEDIVWTVDFLVRDSKGRWTGIFVKKARSAMRNPKEKKSYDVQEAFLQAHGIPIRSVFADEISDAFCINVRVCSYCADPEKISSDADYLKHLIFTHQIIIPEMYTEIIPWALMANKYKEEILYAKIKSEKCNAEKGISCESYDSD